MTGLLLAVTLLARSEATLDRAAVVAKLQAWLDGTATLETKFRQSLVSGALHTTTSETGRLTLERPGKIRWDYLDPERKVATLVGDRTMVYLEADRQMTRGRLSPEQGLFPRLLAGKERIESLFSPTLVATPASGGDGTYKLRLTAKGAAGAISEITLTLKAPQFAIEAADLVDETGNRTTDAFTDLKRNRNLTPGLFAFEPPPGTDIVDEPGP